MPSHCCIRSCRGNYPDGPKVSVYSFPKSDDMIRKWLKFVNRNDLLHPTKHTRCSILCALLSMNRMSDPMAPLKKMNMFQDIVSTILLWCNSTLLKDVKWCSAFVHCLLTLWCLLHTDHINQHSVVCTMLSSLYLSMITGSQNYLSLWTWFIEEHHFGLLLEQICFLHQCNLFRWWDALNRHPCIQTSLI